MNRLILVSNYDCNHGCPDCYYVGRDPITRDNSLLLEIVRTNAPMDLAIGLNNINYESDIEVLREAVGLDCSVILTICADNDLISGLPWDILDSLEALVISVDEYRDQITDANIMAIRRLEVPVFLSILHTSRNVIPIIKGYYESMGLTGTYLLLRKGNPDDGWDLEESVHDYAVVATEIVLHAPGIIRLDECILGNNCLDVWVEVNSNGEVRSCPYRRTPDMIIGSANELSGHEPQVGCKYK